MQSNLNYQENESGQLFIYTHLVNLDDLHYYGGASDLEMVYGYLGCFVAEQTERERKISDLFLQAFRFINDRSNWLAITVLATYILTGLKNSIDCEKVMPYRVPCLPYSN